VGRPKAGENQRLRAYQLFNRGFLPGTIRRALVEEFGEYDEKGRRVAVSLRPVQR